MTKRYRSYKKFKCRECGRILKSTFNMERCPIVDIGVECGGDLEFIEQNKSQPDLKRQWMEALGPGWPCEVWDQIEKIYTAYFSCMEGNITFFCTFLNNTNTRYGWDVANFRPLSTPLDFNNGKATKIQITDHGDFLLLSKNNIRIVGWMPWPNCPEGMKGKTLEIPEDWRIKCQT